MYRPPEGVGQGTKRQAADTASREGNKSVAKRSRNISGSVKGSVKGSDNQFSDKVCTCLMICTGVSQGISNVSSG